MKKLASFIALALLATGCAVNNTGGPKPTGDPVEFDELLTDSLACGNFVDTALILHDEVDVNDFVEGCTTIDESSTVGDELLLALDQTGPDETLIVVTVALGGCLGDYSYEGVFLDDGILRPWMLKTDTAYGRQQVACPADIGESVDLLRAQDAGEGTVAELQVGVWNPDLPGDPYQHHGLE